MRWFLTMAAGLAVAALIVGGAGAEAKIRCDVGPAPFFDVFSDMTPDGGARVRVEWEAMAETTLDCPGMPLIGMDVWEHAVVSVPADGAGPIRGRAQIVIEFTGAGVTVPFEGTVRGFLDDTDLTHVLRGTSPGGARIELEQTGMLDLENGILDDLDVVRSQITVNQDGSATIT